MQRLTWLAILPGIALMASCGPTGTGDPNGGGNNGGVDAAPGGGGDTPDARPNNNGPDAAPCLSEAVSAEEATAPVDIIWVVDSSGSMNDEANAVQNALNDFSSFIASQNIDYRVVLIGDAGEMSVPAPLGGSAEFMHVNVSVGSTNALEKVVQTYPMWQSFLRTNAKVHFVVVTDDESNWSRSTFDSQLAGLNSPGFPSGYTFHSICSEETVLFTPPPPLPPVMGPCMGGLGAGGAAEPGLTYIDMSMATGGVWKSICSSNWDPIFTAVAQSVTVSAQLPCTYALPDPPEGQTLDPDRVNVVFTPTGGTPSAVPRVDNAGACGAGGGWHYDNASNPTQIILCDATCTAFETAGEVNIELGCQTIVD